MKVWGSPGTTSVGPAGEMVPLSPVSAVIVNGFFLFRVENQTATVDQDGRGSQSGFELAGDEDRYTIYHEVVIRAQVGERNCLRAANGFWCPPVRTSPAFASDTPGG